MLTWAALKISPDWVALTVIIWKHRAMENIIFLPQNDSSSLLTSPFPVTSSSFVTRVARFPNRTPVPCVPGFENH